MEQDGSKGLFGYSTMKKICIFFYFALVILGWACICIYLLDYIEKNKNYINAVYILYCIIAFGLVPIFAMIIVYPIYSLAFISEKNVQMNNEQKVIEHLIARITILEDEINKKDSNSTIE